MNGQELEAMFFAALRARDMPAVVDVLRAMTSVDPDRAVRLYDELQTAFAVAKAVKP